MSEVLYSLLGAVFFGWMAARDSMSGRGLGKWVSFGIATVSLIIAFVEYTEIIARRP